MAARASRPAEDTSAREIVITRVFDAPRELVFEAWSEQRHVEQWWGPTGFSCTFERFELRRGGEWVFVMHGPDGRDYPNYHRFEEVVRPERLVYSHGGGRKGDNSDFVSTVTFEAQGNKTRVTMRALFSSAAERDRVVEEYGAIEGGKQHLERLGEYLARMSRQ
ncbi:MAG: SRPBCC domain-containing protein [Candidatus Lambdaproteobacteria bacterium]|nr:SRPBCC domain-containing protein [Candidatus Lambdaproteobacteria bacterium]